MLKIILPLAIVSFIITYLVFSKNFSLVAPPFSSNTQDVVSPKFKNIEEVVPKLDELESSISGLVTKTAEDGVTLSYDIRVNNLENIVADLKNRVEKIEKNTSAQNQQVTSSNQNYPLYIPLGSGGSSGDRNWVSVDTYEINIDPAEYAGYKNMQLEVNMRLVESVGTANARFYNSTDGVALSSTVSTTSDKFVWLFSSGFSLPSGKKTYKLQLQSTDGYIIMVENARVKVNFL